MNFLSATFLQDSSEDDIQGRIREHWEKFLQTDMRTLSKIIGGIKELFD